MKPSHKRSVPMRSAGLGLAGASISLISRAPVVRCLESVAAVGQHSSFIREMSRPLDNFTDASRTCSAANRKTHTRQEDAARPMGSADGFGAHAYAVLALTVLEGASRAHSERPTPYVFADGGPQAPSSCSRTWSRSCCVPHPAMPRRPRQRPTSRSTTSNSPPSKHMHAVWSCRTLVATSWGRPPLARLWTARSPRHPTNGSAAFAEIMGAPSGGVRRRSAPLRRERSGAPAR